METETFSICCFNSFKNPGSGHCWHSLFLLGTPSPFIPMRSYHVMGGVVSVTIELCKQIYSKLMWSGELTMNSKSSAGVGSFLLATDPGSLRCFIVPLINACTKKLMVTCN